MAVDVPTRQVAAWDDFDRRQRELYDLSGALALLDWDQQTYMPPKGAGLRVASRTALAAVVHERLIDPAFGEAIEALATANGSLDEVQAASVRWARWERERALRVPADLVKELSRASGEGFDVWQRARPERDFAAFRSVLERMVSLKQQEADALGHGGERYDALLDHYEPGMRVERLEPLLGALRDDLVPFAQAVMAAPRPDAGFLRRDFSQSGQWSFSMRLLEDVGFDLAAGRQDISAHPFTGGPGPHDVRLTTRFLADDPRSAIMATIHEVGHGLYEQGLGTPRLIGTFAGHAASLGLHESQSRLWENQIGRSRAFWDRYFPVLREHVPGVLDDVDADAWWRAINLVQPSLIRVEADEVTYNLHILVRFEVELALIRGELAVADLPEAFDAAVERYLGIRPPHVGDGVMQDVHWASGSFGYFPTYTLGNLYAAQLHEAAGRDLGGDLDEQVRRGEFAPLLGWLRERIHHQGHLREAEEIARAATGRGLEHETFMRYLRDKYGAIYGVTA